eukprot:COSAG01_NODE_21142_length_916_cov_0.779682_1_plen_74_part_10
MLWPSSIFCWSIYRLLVFVRLVVVARLHKMIHGVGDTHHPQRVIEHTDGQQPKQPHRVANTWQAQLWLSPLCRV